MKLNFLFRFCSIFFVSIPGFSQDADAVNPRVISHQVIYDDASVYAAWPAMVRTHNGDLLLAFTRTEEHLSPNGAIVGMRSTDNGETWSAPEVLYDSPLDDRESGLTVAPNGRVVMHLWSTFWARSNYESLPPEAYPKDYIERWCAEVERPAYRAAERRKGSWVVVSDDHGRTWSDPLPGPDTIHGGTTLGDGTLLVAAYRKNGGAIGIYAAARPEGPWELRQTVSCRVSDKLRFGEPHVLALPGGRVLLMIRATAIPYDDRRDDLFLWETYSDDAGRTWAEPFPTPLWGFPPHLAHLQDGRVLATYGYRRKPYGQRAAISADGITWDVSEEIVIRDDAPNGDLGYPVSLEIEPGKILTVYYQKPTAEKDPHKADIMTTLWTIGVE